MLKVERLNELLEYTIGAGSLVGFLTVVSASSEGLNSNLLCKSAGVEESS